MKKLTYVKDLLIMFGASVISAIALHCFVGPAHYAPSGIDGISMMTQELTGINMGYVSLMINIPLLIVAWFFISRKYVVYTTIFTAMTSGMLIFMEQYFPDLIYKTETNLWISVFTSGIIMGARTAMMMKIGGSSGGVDIIASVIQKQRPYLNIETLIAAACYIIIGVSFFVYGNIESVIMSVVQMVVFNLSMNSMMKSTRNAVEVKIITNQPEQFKHDILVNLKHGGTAIKCTGMYTDDDKTMIVTLINIRQMNDLIKIARKYPDSFIYFSEAGGVWGNFRWHKHDPV
jgi:uncharacterized membrane-anchored protein YitT (DUF2179 family)